jgi:creatinine amidohydrolase/Fe(II)-dependent formamide hydrolase-like protein
MNTPHGVRLDDLTRQEATSRFAGDAVVVIPAAGGSLLPAHLPLKTPAVIVRALAQKLADRLDVVLAPVVEPDGPALTAHIEKLRRLGARRLAVLELHLWAGTSCAVPDDVLMLRAADRSDGDEYATSCMMALDPRSVRMPLLPAGSRAQAFDGERGMAAEAEAVAAALLANWPDLVRR